MVDSEGKHSEEIVNPKIIKNLKLKKKLQKEENCQWNRCRNSGEDSYSVVGLDGGSIIIIIKCINYIIEVTNSSVWNSTEKIEQSIPDDTAYLIFSIILAY